MRRKPVMQRLSLVLICAILFIGAWFSLDTAQRNEDLSDSSDLLEVHFIDVGQADAILIKQGKSALLIDAGNNGDADTLLEYLKREEVNRLDFLVATHPHEDHIGGLDTVIDHVDIGTILMPDIITDTKTFEDVLTAIENKSLKITKPKTGQIYYLGNVELTILSPDKMKYGELNDYSIAIRLVYGNESFLFLGDCETLNEEEMLGSGLELDSDVIKLGHHGSDSSSSETFLKAVSPLYAVISVGQDNDYNHPSEIVLERLNMLDVEVLRTDQMGTIVLTTDGKSLKITPSPDF